jgi:argininosuccinate synthase
MYIDPSVKVIAPWREWDLKSRSDCIDYARARGIPVPVTTEKPYSMDRNLLHISYEGGVLEDPWNAPQKDMFLLTTDPVDAPEQPEEVVIGFEQGNPVSVNGETLAPVALMTRLNELAGKHGVGRVDIVESRYVGMKSRGVYETPGGTVLYKAHRAMESLTVDREQIRLRDAMVPEYSTLVYRGFWFSPEREMLQSMVDATQAHVTGDVRVQLYKGSVQVTGRRSPHSLYREEFSTFEQDEVYDQSDATGFIRLTALRLRLDAMRNRS